MLLYRALVKAKKLLPKLSPLFSHTFYFGKLIFIFEAVAKATCRIYTLFKFPFLHFSKSHFFSFAGSLSKQHTTKSKANKPSAPEIKVLTNNTIFSNFFFFFLAIPIHTYILQMF